MKRQSEMVSFLSSIEIVSDESFLSVPMHDPEVRMFIQEDLPLLQSFGFPVILPAWLKSVTESKMRVRTNASVQSYNSATDLMKFFLSIGIFPCWTIQLTVKLSKA